MNDLEQKNHQYLSGLDERVALYREPKPTEEPAPEEFYRTEEMISRDLHACRSPLREWSYTRGPVAWADESERKVHLKRCGAPGWRPAKSYSHHIVSAAELLALMPWTKILHNSDGWISVCFGLEDHGLQFCPDLPQAITTAFLAYKDLQAAKQTSYPVKDHPYA